MILSFALYQSPTVHTDSGTLKYMYVLAYLQAGRRMVCPLAGSGDFKKFLRFLDKFGLEVRCDVRGVDVCKFAPYRCNDVLMTAP